MTTTSQNDVRRLCNLFKFFMIKYVTSQTAAASTPLMKSERRVNIVSHLGVEKLILFLKVIQDSI